MLTKSPIRLAGVALAVARRALPVYRSKFSRRDFTWPQLVACLIVQRFFRMDYRGFERLLYEYGELRRTLELERVPDHSTLCRALHRLSLKELERLLDETVAAVNRLTRRRRDGQRKTVVVDSTGLRSDHQSRYFYRRLGRKCPRRSWPKWSIAIDRELHVILGQVADKGPCSDHVEFKPVVRQAQRRRPSDELLADAGYDSEENHRWCRQEQNVVSIIRVKTGRPRSRGSPIKGRYRRTMHNRFPCRRYRQRWQAESAFSAHKRRFGDDLRSTTAQPQCIEIMLRGILHNCAVWRRHT